MKKKKSKNNNKNKLRLLEQIKEVYSDIYILEKKRKALNSALRLKNNRLKSYLNFLRSE